MTTLKQVFCRPTEDELSRFKSISDLESLSDKDAAWEECIIDATHFNCHRFFTHGGTFTSCDIDDVNRLGLIEVTTEQFFDLLDDRITVWRLIERGYDKHPSKEIYAKKTEAGASIVVDFEDGSPSSYLTVINHCMIPLIGVFDMRQLDGQESLLSLN